MDKSMLKKNALKVEIDVEQAEKEDCIDLHDQLSSVQLMRNNKAGVITTNFFDKLSDDSGITNIRVTVSWE